jgi:hypothetical protein
MGGSASKPIELPKEVDRKYGKLLLEPAVVKKFDELRDLVENNAANNMYFLTRLTKRLSPDQAPLMDKVEAMYEGMIQDVIRARGVDRDTAYGYLTDNRNLYDYFLKVSGSDGRPVQDADYIRPAGKKDQGGGVAGPIQLDVDRFIDNLRARDGKMRYYQFKFIQCTLFQAAFAHAMWEIARVFVTSTTAFHKSRENVFHSVMTQMFAIINKYTGGETLTVKEMDDIESVRKQMEDAQKMLEVKQMLDKQKTTSLKSVLDSMVKIDPEGFGPDYGKLVPSGAGSSSTSTSTVTTERQVRETANKSSTNIDSTQDVRKRLAEAKTQEEVNELMQEMQWRLRKNPQQQQQQQQQFTQQQQQQQQFTPQQYEQYKQQQRQQKYMDFLKKTGQI